jgi:hypothetical protein
MTQQIRTASPIGARCIVASIYWRRNNLLSFSFYISVSVLSAISVSQSLHLLPHIHLPRHLHLLATSISLHYTEKHKIFKTGASNLLRLAYSWGHCLKIVVYLAETEIHLNLRTTAKVEVPGRHSWVESGNKCLRS